jgi:RimJ/RimL family protein N-acetyltransferase
MIQLKRLVSLKNCEDKIKKYKTFFEVYSVMDDGELHIFLWKSSRQQNQETLLIAATDETIRLGKESGIAALAYRNPSINGQTLSGVEYLVESFDEVDASYLEKVYQRYHHIPWTIAKTDRCIIREMTLDDMDALFELYSDKSLTQYIQELLDYEEETRYQSAYINHMYRYFGYGMWLVFLKDTGELIGRAGLENRELYRECERCPDVETESHTVIEIGYLIKKAYQCQGFAKEVCQAILQYAEEELEIEEVNCFIEEGNTPSIKLSESLGFSYLETIVEQDRKMLRFIRKSNIIKY